MFVVLYFEAFLLGFGHFTFKTEWNCQRSAMPSSSSLTVEEFNTQVDKLLKKIKSAKSQLRRYDNRVSSIVLLIARLEGQLHHLREMEPTEDSSPDSTPPVVYRHFDIVDIYGRKIQPSSNRPRVTWREPERLSVGDWPEVD